MSKKIVKLIRASLDYLLETKSNASINTQKVIDFLLRATFLDKDDDYFQKIVKAEGCDAPKYQWFNGKRFTRQEDGHYRGYHGKYLHRAVWEYYNGEIPSDCVVHHKDLNPENNDISNLELIKKADHRKLHAEMAPEETYICEYCGKEYTRRHKGKPNRFCSRECGSKWNYKYNHEIRICPECGKEFSTYKYGPTKHCSKECAIKASAKGHLGIKLKRKNKTINNNSTKT